MCSRFQRGLVSFVVTLTVIAVAGKLNAQRKTPVPDAASSEASQKAAGELFGDHLRSAKTATEKSAVAAEMVQGAVKLQDGSADQYVPLKQASWQEYRRALAVMEDKPADPAANSTAGRYLCLVKGDWQQGVPMLALGSDAALRGVAMMEVRGADSTKEQAAIADAWWDLAPTRPSPEREKLLLRAGSWYRAVEPALPGGLARLKIEHRLAEIAKLGSAIPPLSPPPRARPAAPPGPRVRLVIVEAWSTELESETCSLAFSPDGRLLAASGLTNDVALLDIPSLDVATKSIGHRKVVRAVAFSPDGRLVASGDISGIVKLWDAASGRALHTLRGHTDRLFDAAFSPDGRLLATTGNDRSIRLWDVATGRERTALKGHESWVWSIAFSPDGKRLASGGGDKTARLWDVASGTQAAVLSGHGGKVRNVRYLAGGQTLVTSCDDRTARFWDLQNLQQQQYIHDEQGVSSADISPDGRLLVTSADTGIIRFWDVASGRLLLTAESETTEVCWGLRFSPSGRQLALGGDKKMLQLWTLNWPKWDAAKGP
jgi:WD40 repeat protein